MFMFTTPESSAEAHEFLLGIEEKVLGKLEIPYRIVNIAVGDLGAPAAKKYDIEGWLPGQQRYRELTSCSNTTDYQARRLQTRVRRVDGSLETPHTLNGTATAIGRTLIAIKENHQRADGSVEIPEHLWQYLPERVRVLAPTA
jgi:seryl-tRNA synthetase